MQTLISLRYCILLVRSTWPTDGNWQVLLRDTMFGKVRLGVWMLPITHEHQYWTFIYKKKNNNKACQSSCLIVFSLHLWIFGKIFILQSNQPPSPDDPLRGTHVLLQHNNNGVHHGNTPHTSSQLPSWLHWHWLLVCKSTNLKPRKGKRRRYVRECWKNIITIILWREYGLAVQAGVTVPPPLVLKKGR